MDAIFWPVFLLAVMLVLGLVGWASYDLGYQQGREDGEYQEQIEGQED